MRFDTEVRIPYRWSTGPAYRRFLEGLRDARLLGSRCAECDTVQVPPTERCRRCASAQVEDVEVTPRGRLQAACAVDESFPGGPASPYTLGLIELEDGGRLLHRVHDDDTEAIGDDVAAVWADERSGSILDIAYFTRADR